MPELKPLAAASESAPSTDLAAVYPNRKPEELELVSVYNQSSGQLHHDDYKLLPGSSLEVPAFIADIWLKITHLGRPRVILLSDKAKAPAPLNAAEVEALRAQKAAAEADSAGKSLEIDNLAKLVAQLQGQIAAGPVKPGKTGSKGANMPSPAGDGGNESPPAS